MCPGRPLGGAVEDGMHEALRGLIAPQENRGLFYLFFLIFFNFFYIIYSLLRYKKSHGALAMAGTKL